MAPVNMTVKRMQVGMNGYQQVPSPVRSAGKPESSFPDGVRLKKFRLTAAVTMVKSLVQLRNVKPQIVRKGKWP